MMLADKSWDYYVVNILKQHADLHIGLLVIMSTWYMLQVKNALQDIRSSFTRKVCVDIK